MSEVKNIPNDWVETTLGKSINLIGGGTPNTSTPEFWSGEIPWLSVVDFNDDNRWVYSTEKSITELGLKKSSTKLLSVGDIIISARGTVGAVAQLKKEMAFNQSCYGIKEKENISDINFIFYLLKYSLKQINRNTYGAVFDTITTKTFDIINVILPSLPEQKAIASILTAFDHKIELLQAQNKTLEETAQTIFTEWFNKNSDKYEITRLGDIITIRGGYSYKGNELGKGNSFLLGMGCVSNNNRFLSKGARLYSDNFPQTYLIEPGEIVLATRQQSENLPILGYPAIVPNDYKGKRVLVGTNLYMVKNNSLLNNEILFLLFKSEAYRNHILNNSKGTTVKMITKDSIENFKFKMPTKDEINKCQNLILPLIEKLKINEDQIQALTKTRDELLPKLMSGEVRINEFKV